MRFILYSRPILEDLSQESRIRFIRIFRHLSQENVSDDLGITDENKRRTMTRYEKGDRKPSKERLNEIAKILLINENLIKDYDFKTKTDIIYFLLWLEELYPRLRIDLSTDDYVINRFLNEWKTMREKRLSRKISYEDYIEWKINCIVEENLSNEKNNRN